VKIEAFLLCDAATDQGGKLNVLGAFDTINGGETPIVQRHCTVALRIRFDALEAGEHRLRLAVIDADGHEVVPAVTGKAQVRVRGEVGSTAANFILNFSGLKFPEFGSYEVRLQVDGEEQGALPLNVRQTPPPGGLPRDLPPPP